MNGDTLHYRIRLSMSHINRPVQESVAVACTCVQRHFCAASRNVEVQSPLIATGWRFPCTATHLIDLLSVQEEMQEYATESKLRELVGKYSEFINFPIYLYESKEVDVPVEEDEDAAETPGEAGELSTEDIEDEGRSSLSPAHS